MTRMGVILLLWAAACGGDETAPAIRREQQPPPGPAPAPTVIADERAADEPAPLPPAPPPPVPTAAAETAPVADFTELATTEETFRARGREQDVTFDVIEHPVPRAREQLKVRVRAALSVELLTGEGDVHGQCRATLALPAIASYLCTHEVEVERGTVYGGAFSKTFVIDRGTVRGIDPAEAFVPGADIAAAARVLCETDTEEGTTDREACQMLPVWSLALEGVKVHFALQDEGGYDGTIPYYQLAPLVRRPGLLASFPEPHPDERDEVDPAYAAAAAPPANLSQAGRALGAAGTLVEVARRWRAIDADLRARTERASGLRIVIADGGQARIVAPVGGEWTEERTRALAERIGVAVEPTAYHGAHLTAVVSRTEEVVLRDSPRGAAAPVRALPEGTQVTALHGAIGASESVPSRLAGTWSFVVTDGGEWGWAASHLVEREDRTARSGLVEELVATVPEVDREAVRRSALVALQSVKLEGTETPVWLAVAHGRPGSGSFLRVSAERGELARLRLAAPITRVRLLAPVRDGAGPTLLVTATSVPGETPGLELWSARVLGSEAPVLEVPLPTGPDAPDEQRVRVATPHRPTARARDWSPFAVLGPGRAIARYTWDGTTLVPPPAGTTPP